MSLKILDIVIYCEATTAFHYVIKYYIGTVAQNEWDNIFGMNV